MLLVCECSVVDKSVKSAPIPYPSQITIVEEVVNFRKHLYLQIVRSEAGRRTEERYRLLNNVLKLDTAYVKENILSISLKNPKCNVFIKSDISQLNFFVKALKLACGKRIGRNFTRAKTREPINLAGSSRGSQAPKPIGGIGLKLLQNMGWKPGEGLGKDKTGVVEPLQIEQKVDKIGLYTSEDNTQHLMKGPQRTVAAKSKRKPKPEMTFGSKHPVSLLSEFAARNKWKNPDYNFSVLSRNVSTKIFSFCVTVNDTKYESTVEAIRQKEAKIFAARYVLQILAPHAKITDLNNKGV